MVRVLYEVIVRDSAATGKSVAVDIQVIEFYNTGSANKFIKSLQNYTGSYDIYRSARILE